MFKSFTSFSLTINNSNKFKIPSIKVSSFNFHHIDWSKILTLLATKIISFIALCLIFMLIRFIGKKIIKKVILRPKKGEKKPLGKENGHTRTIYTLVSNIFHYTVLFFFLYTVLSLFGVPVATLLASAGIASVAIGLGAQGFITDVVTGFFILLEQQFIVGDDVKIANIEGTVQAIGLRTTQVLGEDGTLYFIPNRNITIVSNMSRNPMRALINIRVDENTNITKMTQIIKEVNEKLVPTQTDIIKGPTIQGLVDIGKGDLVFRIVIITKNGSQSSIQRKFLHAYLKALKDVGFKIPVTRIDLYPEKKAPSLTSPSSQK